jgi:hypothetical protein
VWPVTDIKGLVDGLKKNPHVTHVNISAPWLPTMEIASLAYQNPEIRFTCTSHSNVGFLQADTKGVQLIREEMDLEQNSFNFRIAGNSQRYVKWLQNTYKRPCLWLPNLYHLDHLSGRPYREFHRGTLRIGAFGAVRPLKNLMTAGAAALTMAENLRCQLEFSISGNRNEGGGATVNSLHEMFRGVSFAKLIEIPWQQWSDFRRTAGNQNLLLQPSYTETFNIVTADGIAEGVPSVVSEAIDWAPKHWKADVDDALDIARVGQYLLQDSDAPQEGLNALLEHNEQAVKSWIAWLNA